VDDVGRGSEKRSLSGTGYSTYIADEVLGVCPRAKETGVFGLFREVV
jgi:hypothetical protein